MKYISHIKELVSGIIENNLVTRDTEAYNALTALKNHLETLDEVQKYMPYRDPGPCIQKLEQSLTQANTRYQELRKKFQDLNDENAHHIAIIDQNHQAIENYQNLKEELKQKDSYIEDLKKQTSDAQCDLDNWINYKGPDLKYQIGILEQKLRIAESLLIGEQKTQYQEQTNPLDIPGNKTLLDQKQDEIGFLKNHI